MGRPSASRRIGPRPAVALLGLLLAACATAPPEPQSRQSTLATAAAECAAGRPGLKVVRVDPDGRVHVTVGPGGERDVPVFNACYAQKAQETLSRAQVIESRAPADSASGRPGAHVTSVPIRLVNRKVLVPVGLNGGPPATFILDTGSNITVVSPGLARSLGVEGGPSEPRGTARMASGQEVAVTARRLESIAVGGARIDNFGVVIYDLVGVSSSAGPGIVVDGLLGIDFIGRFTTTLDPRNQTLIFQLDDPSPR